MNNKLFIIFAATVAAVALGFWFVLRPDLALVNESLHSALEAVESIAALLMALFLLDRKEEDASGNSALLALGFLAMGILTAAHAASSTGNQFVFLRATASLAGGLGFGLVWLPARHKALLDRAWLLWFVITGSLIVCVVAFLFPAAFPAMVHEARFAAPAVTINLLAGMLFVAGSVRLMIAVYRSNALEDQLFSLIGMFFGLSGLTFQYTALWSEGWWYWHVLRLIGSMLVLGLLVHRHLHMDATLKTSLLERKKAELSLRRSYELTKTIIDSMNDAVSLLDVRDFRIIGVNSSFLKEYGYSDETEIVGKRCYEITHRRPDVCDVPDGMCPLAVTVRTGKHAAADHVHYDSRGEKVYVEVSTSPIKDEDGKVVQVVHVARDITDRRRAEEERELLLADIARSNKDLEQFASVASHDLKEPLRMVSAYVQRLEKKYKGRLDEKADKYIRFALEGVERMEKLIEGLLAYSRITRGGSQFGPVDSNRIFSLAVSNLSASIHESTAEVTSGDLPLVLGDEIQLLQLLQNLIGNAIKYRKPQTPPHVQVTSAREGSHYVFAVRDNGIGIDPKNYDRIFQLFQRLHSHDQYAGAGIGLAVCKRIVERHNGRIWVESVPGAGSTFFFTVPAAAEERDAFK